ncbi:MAG: hypothetical protein ACFE8P_00195 [Promethearchaeota archaeon]
MVIGILAILGLGISGYLLATNQYSGTSTPESEFILVALWDDLNRNTTNPSHTDDDDFLIQFDDNIFLDPQYITVNSVTNFSLTRAGIYRITLRIIISSIELGERYVITLLKSGAYDECFWVFTANVSASSNINSALYLNASITDYYEINAYCDTDDANGFDTALPRYNQLAIEYLSK